MKRHYLVFSFVVLVGMLFGFMLIPQKNELSLLYLKDKDYAAALKSYKKELSEGNLSVSVVIPMVHLYLQYGDVNSAVEAMERFVDKNPNNADALRKLGILYQYAQRPNDYLHNLEKLNHIVPSEQTLRELSALYNFTAKYDGQIAVLQTLANSYPASPKYLIDLANLQASQRLIHNASDTLRLLKKRYPDVFSGDITELFINLLLDEGNPSEAFENASSWLSNHKDPYTATRYASLLHFKSQPAFALQLLLPFSDVAAGHPNLLSEFSQLLIVNGREEEAFTRLKGLYERRLLPEKLYETFIELALSKKKYILAINAARQADFTKFPGGLIGLKECMISA
ncbi:MAG: hypothetical protein HY279_00930 [Nitrospinae bacterium]|nr:hypothetical protein [Nitrospinota bacterium]